MNWREGLKRLAVALGWVYWALAAPFIYFEWRDGMNDYDSNYDSVWDWANMGDATREALQLAGGFAVAFAVLMFIYQGLRWVARGFITR
ncbi:hypothetical protein [Devosia sp.]|uniref:hypothetical protein n=1 Tax=Devosia sp. TaxID=1871048 RepID=UPI002FC904DA